MSDLVVDFIMSLDGYGAAEGWPGLWGLEGPEYLDYIKADEADDHAVLMGATTYRLMYRGLPRGRDGTRTRDLRRDRPAL